MTGSTIALIEQAADIAREGLVCLSCGHVGAATGECCDHPDYDGGSPEQIAEAIIALLTPELSTLLERCEKAEKTAKNWEASYHEACKRWEKAEAERDQLAVNYMERTLERNAAEAQSDTAIRERDAARKALEPFIRLADEVFSDGKNENVTDGIIHWYFNDISITFGDLRRARASSDREGGE